MTVTTFAIEHLGHLLGLAGLVMCSGFFSGSETALFSLSRAQLLKFRQGDRRTGHVVARLMGDPHGLLMVLLMGNQLVNVAFYAVSATLIFELAAAAEAGWLAEAGLLAAPLLVLILLGEVGPKGLALAFPGRFAQVVAVPLAGVVRLLGPVQSALSVWLIEPLTRLFSPSDRPGQPLTADELSALLAVSGKQGAIGANESAWLQEVIELGRLRVTDIMVPRVDMVAYDVDAPPAGLVELFRRSGLVKVPVYRGDLDNTVGLVHAKALLLSGGVPLEELARPIPYVPEAGTVDKLLQQFRKTRTQMAIVVDEYGGTAGLVTLEDALEEIVGEIASPGEPPAQPVRELGGGEYLIDGNLPIHEWLDAFGMDLPSARVSTMGGLVMSLLGHVPAVGDKADYRNLQFTVEAVDRHRVRRLRLRLKEAQP